MVSGGQSRNFTFNGDNKQVEIKNGNSAVGRYFYDGEGKRVKKVTNLETTIFVYDGLGKLVAEYSTDISPSPQIKYLTEDHLGTPRIITDATGQITARRDFLPFGEDLFAGVGARSAAQKYGATADDVRQKFTGYQKDKETSLDFAEARMYQNKFGRFTAVDPLLASGKSANPQTFNRYVYTSNNPIARVDRNGMIWGKHEDGTVRWFAKKLGTGFSEYRPENWTYKGESGKWVRLSSNSKNWRYVDAPKPAVSMPSQGNETVRALTHSIADNSPSEATLTLMSLPVATPVLAPALVIAGPSAIAATGSPITQSLIAGLAGGGIGMVIAPSGGSGGGLPPELSGRLNDIYSQYPKDSFQCDCAANESLDAFRNAGIDGKIVQLETGLDTMMSSDGTVISRSGFHQAVQVGDMFYDSLTGAEGARWDVYQTLIEQDQFHPLRVTTPRPFIPPQQ